MNTQFVCDKLQEFINKYVEGLTIICNGNDWYYDWRTDEININLYYNEEADRLFSNVCKELGLNWNCPMPLMSYLHEVGHYQTIEDCDTLLWNLTDIYTRLKGIMSDEITEKDHYVYFFAPRERVATEWACDFANTHKTELIELWHALTSEH